MNIRVLVIAEDVEVLEEALAGLQAVGVQATGSADEAEAMHMAGEQPFDVVVFTPGVSPTSRGRLAWSIRPHQPRALLMQPRGGGGGVVGQILSGLPTTS